MGTRTLSALTCTSKILLPLCGELCMPIELPYFTGLGGTCRVQLGTKRVDLGFYRDNAGKAN